MGFGDELILIGSGLIVLSIFAGLVSSRMGAPLLLVFLVLGMLAGEDGPGGIEFDDFEAAYLLGSVSLAVILFDGGLRTPLASFRLALRPALVLATVGVVLTAALTGLAATLLLQLTLLEGMLVGSLVASTDAAAVFFLLHLHGARLQERVSATLEIESGLNDPMAIFLTIVFVRLVAGAQTFDGSLGDALELAREFAVQIVGGGAIGVVGGFALVWLINRVPLASGLYPVFAIAFALLLFAITQMLGGSGYVAAYLVGLVLGNHRHRATTLINRFQDGLAWLCQIAMFLVLGLLVTPTRLLPVLLPALGVAVVLIVIARPVAVALCLWPFGMSRREVGFVSWVGLRGAVPIFLGTIPVLAGLPGAETYFSVVFVVVLVSLLVQGWTVITAAERFGLRLPQAPEAPQRMEMDLPAEVGRDMIGYVIQPKSRIVGQRPSRLLLPPDSDVVSVVRDGVMRPPDRADRLAPGDTLIVTVAPGQIAMLDRLFVGPRAGGGEGPALGEFSFTADVALGAVAGFYGIDLAGQPADLTLGEFLHRRLREPIVVGDRARLSGIELIVEEIADGRIVRVALELEPEEWTPAGLPVRFAAWRRRLARAGLVRQVGALARRLRARLAPLRAQSAARARALIGRRPPEESG